MLVCLEVGGNFVFVGLLIGFLAAIYFIFTAATGAGKAAKKTGIELRKALEAEAKEVEKAPPQYPKEARELAEIPVKEAIKVVRGKPGYEPEAEAAKPPFGFPPEPKEEAAHIPPYRGVNFMARLGQGSKRFLAALKKLFE